LVDLPKLWPLPPLGDLVFRLGFSTLFLSLCAWWLRAAWIGWRRCSAGAVRGLCLASTFAACVFCDVMIGKLHREPAGQTPSVTMAPELVAAVLGTVVYFVSSRLLVSRLGLKDERSPAEQIRSVKWWLRLVAFLLWTNFGEAAFALVPKEHNIPKNPWDFVMFLGPAVLAYILYKLGVRLLTPRPE
jgi:hypothetical protein